MFEFDEDESHSYQRPDDVTVKEFAKEVGSDLINGVGNVVKAVVLAPFRIGRYLVQSPRIIDHETKKQQGADDVYMLCSMALYGKNEYKDQARIDLKARGIETDDETLRFMMRQLKQRR